jgi:transglutaminase-like putative cysteine protease
MGETNPGVLRSATPHVLEVSTPGEFVIDDERATMDYSNISEGYFCVRSKLGATKIKVLVNINDSQYQYTIQNTPDFVTIPLSEGNGNYAVGVWENVTDDKYAAVFSCELDVQLSDEFKPYLYPNQFVDFQQGDAAAQLSEKLATGATSDIEAINGIYSWVVENVSYDEEKAVTVASGYLPNNKDTISSQTGICFDYAVLTASMLRAQGIPAKLVIGYAGAAYHAWIEVYGTDTGKIIAGYMFDGQQWVRMDPTFNAASGGMADLSSTIGDGENYQPLFYY